MTPSISDYKILSGYSSAKISRNLTPKFAKLSVLVTKSTIVLRSFFVKMRERAFFSYGIVSNSRSKRFILWISVAMCV